MRACERSFFLVQRVRTERRTHEAPPSRSDALVAVVAGGRVLSGEWIYIYEIEYIQTPTRHQTPKRQSPGAQASVRGVVRARKPGKNERAHERMTILTSRHALTSPGRQSRRPAELSLCQHQTNTNASPLKVLAIGNWKRTISDFAATAVRNERSANQTLKTTSASPAANGPSTA